MLNKYTWSCEVLVRCLINARATSKNNNKVNVYYVLCMSEDH